MKFNIFKIEYSWYEGEHEETFIGKAVEQNEFGKDLVEARDFAKSLIGKKAGAGNCMGKGYSIECLPEYYEQIIWFLLEKKGYVECCSDEAVSYDVNDNGDGNIALTKYEKEIKESEL